MKERIGCVIASILLLVQTVRLKIARRKHSIGSSEPGSVLEDRALTPDDQRIVLGRLGDEGAKDIMGSQEAQLRNKDKSILDEVYDRKQREEREKTSKAVRRIIEPQDWGGLGWWLVIPVVLTIIITAYLEINSRAGWDWRAVFFGVCTGIVTYCVLWLIDSWPSDDNQSDETVEVQEGEKSDDRKDF